MYALLISLLAAPQAHAAEVSVISALVQSHLAPPGGTAEGEILIRNNDRQPHSVIVYQTDYLFQADGSNTFDPIGSAPRSNGAWISLGAEELVLDPGETRPLYFTVAVPDDPSLVGTWWSMVMIEGMDRSFDPDYRPAMDQVAVGAKFRYGVQIVTEVPGESAAALAVVDRRLTKARALEIDMENSGARLAVPTVWAELFDSEGASLGRVEAGERRLYPGCSTRFSFDLSDLEQDNYTALVVMDAGEDGVVGSQYTLDLR